MSRLATTALFSLVFACGGDEKEEACDFTPGDEASGETLYAATCAGCHGGDGSGGTGPALTEKVPDLDDCELDDVIMNGGGDMPATGLSMEQSEDVVAYLRATFGG